MGAVPGSPDQGALGAKQPFRVGLTRKTLAWSAFDPVAAVRDAFVAARNLPFARHPESTPAGREQTFSLPRAKPLKLACVCVRDTN